EGKYVGGADNLEKWLAAKGLDKVPNNVVEIPSQSA
ncbi:TPA: glutaredoxin, partial [Vibrio parahaemolyticus]|nr:glutaredoxin [Vibrio parahaemolyticus]